MQNVKIVMVLATIAPNAERTDGSISPTLLARAGTGGGQLPILILREDADEREESVQPNQPEHRI